MSFWRDFCGSKISQKGFVGPFCSVLAGLQWSHWVAALALCKLSRESPFRQPLVRPAYGLLEYVSCGGTVTVDCGPLLMMLFEFFRPRRDVESDRSMHDGSQKLAGQLCFLNEITKPFNQTHTFTLPFQRPVSRVLLLGSFFLQAACTPRSLCLLV